METKRHVFLVSLHSQESCLSIRTTSPTGAVSNGLSVILEASTHSEVGEKLAHAMDDLKEWSSRINRPPTLWETLARVACIAEHAGHQIGYAEGYAKCTKDVLTYMQTEADRLRKDLDRQTNMLVEAASRCRGEDKS